MSIERLNSPALFGLAMLSIVLLSCSSTSGVDEIAEEDGISPSGVVDLEVVAFTDESVTLTWTAPGDDSTSGTAAAYDVPDALLAMLNLAAAGAFVTITIVVALAAFLYRRAAPAEEYLLLSTLLLVVTLGFGTITHYWFVALPFAAILCARLFSGDQKVIMSPGE